MNKGLLIGVGALAVLGIGGYFWWRSKNSSGATSSSELKSGDAGTPSSESSASTPSSESIAETLSTSAPTSKKEARQERKQKRRDCRAEAKAQGLKGKAKRQFKRECKASGGISDEFVSEESDFAFNGFASFD